MLQSSFCVGHLLLGMGPALKRSLYIQWDSLGENQFFSCEKLEIASGLGVWACVYSQHWNPVRPRPVQTLYMLPQSLWASLCIWPAVVSFIPSGFSNISTSATTVPWALREKDVMETSHLGPSVPRSLTLPTVQLWVSIFSPSTSEGSFSNDGRVRLISL